MGRRESYAAGTFCAVDLVTPDREASKKFYNSLMGWEAVDYDGAPYTGFRLDGLTVAGAIPLSDEMLAAGAAPAWTTYVKVDDVDAHGARVAELGGTLLGEPLAIDGVGRTVPFADPQGAVLLAWEPAGFEGAELVNQPGAWAWNDLQTPDPDGVLEFYEGLFGWEIEPIEASGGVYWSIRNDGHGIGGIMRSAQTPRPFWTVYFGVDEIEPKLATVAEHGGTTLLEPMAVPTGRFAMAIDPQGAPVCFVEGQFDD
jgi:predicted enzyme related to lactoylglutathione lyase